MTGTLAALQARLQESLNLLTGLEASAARRVEATRSALDVRAASLADLQEHRAAQAFEEVRAAVLEKVAHERFADLTPREARTAAKMMASLTPGAMWKLLWNRSELWPTFAETMFRQWDVTQALPTRREYAALLDGAPAEVSFLRGDIPPQSLASPAGPRLLAQASLGRSIAESERKLLDRGFSPRWGFTAHCLVEVAGQFLAHMGHDAVWGELAAQPHLATALLPPPSRGDARWFFAGRPSTARGSGIARASFVALALQNLKREKRGVDDGLAAALLDSELGDPRIPPESAGWQVVRERSPEAYADFLEQLVREDLTLFFEHAMNEPARRKFWLAYIKSIRRTVCVLGPETARDLRRRLAGSSAEVRASLERVRQFSTQRGVSAFCLYFDTHVVVEFSDTGNAAYVYARSDFDKRIEPTLMANRLRAHDDLKTSSRVDRILHTSGWQAGARALLQKYGVRAG